MHISRIIIGKPQALSLQAVNPYRWHQLLWECFPGRPDADRDFLFRLDDREREFCIQLLSAHGPAIPPWGSWSTRVFEPEFAGGGRYFFQLRANPTRRSSETRALAPIVDEPELSDYLVAKAAAHGFRLLAAPAISVPIVLKFRKNAQTIVLNQVDFAGVLEVTDPAALSEALATGIGRAKAFGCGMLLLRKMS